jgi:hypothetical protein
MDDKDLDDVDGASPSNGFDAKCWLCGRAVESREGVNLVRRSGIPVHRECLEDGRKCYAAGTPLADPDDVIYFSATLFRT